MNSPKSCLNCTVGLLTFGLNDTIFRQSIYMVISILWEHLLIWKLVGLA